MKKTNNDKDRLRRKFPKHDSLNQNDKLNERYAFNGQHYATAKNEIIKRFKLILRSQEVVSVPYSLLPIITLKGNSEINITAYELTITIKGRSLDIIEELLSNEVILWLKETPSNIDDEMSDVFISQITIEGSMTAQ